MTRVVAAVSFLAVLGVAVSASAPDGVLRSAGRFLQSPAGFAALAGGVWFCGQLEVAIRDVRELVAERRKRRTDRLRRQRDERLAAEHQRRFDEWWETARPDPAANPAA